MSRPTPFARLGRVVLELGCAALLVVSSGCAKPRPGPPNTLDSPRDVAAVRVCGVGPQLRRGVDVQSVGRWTSDCTGAGHVDITYGAIANSGNRFVHIVRVEGRQAGYVDYDPSIPGNTGLSVPDGPTQVELTGHPTIVAVASEREPALSFVELTAGTRASVAADGVDAGGSLALSEPVSTLRSLRVPAGSDLRAALASPTCESDCASVLVGARPQSNRLSTWLADASCDGSRDEWTPDCEASVELASGPSITLPGSVVDFTVGPSGRAWVSVRDSRTVLVVGLFGRALAQECAGVPCVIGHLPVAPSCSDGIDDDGDGLVDAEDPQCFSPDDEESGTVVAGSALGEGFTACTDGRDDDGDGLIDADDPDCRDSGDRVEGPGYDGVISIGFGAEAAGDQIALSMSEAALPGDEPPAPACSNGEDDDGDGAIDWPEDTDCYGPNGESEAPPPMPFVSALVLTEERDLVAAVERRSRQVYFFDAQSGALLRVNELDPLHSTYGVALTGQFPGPAIADTTTRVVPLATPIGDTTHVSVTQRRIHVATTSGFAETVVIDTEWAGWDGHPGPDLAEPTASLVEGPYTDTDFEPRDLNGRSASVRRVDCRIPSTLDTFLPVAVSCNDSDLPYPAVIGSGEACTPADGESLPPYYENDGDCFGLLTSTERHLLADPEDEPTTAIVQESRSDDYAVLDGVWEVVWQGVLNGTDRSDALVVDEGGGTRGWIGFAGQEPCRTSTPTLCSDGTVDRRVCPELFSLCQAYASADPNTSASEAVCAADLDVCDLCPSACRAAPDMCAAGVIAGDILVVDPFETNDSERCAPFSSADTDTAASERARLEFEVCTVGAGVLEVATFGSGCPGRDARSAPYATVSSLPPAECLNGPIRARVRSGGWLVRVGSLIGPSPYRAVDGRCVFRTDAETSWMRARLGQEFSSIYGLTLELRHDTLEGAEDAVVAANIARDFAIAFDVDRAFTFRSDRSRELLLGPATSGLAVVDTRNDRRIVLVDESQSFLWLFRALDYRGVGQPLP